jgi:dolichol-phosphate mannosyltransferase
VRTVVVIPTYNEAENLEEIVHRLRRSQPAIDVLIVDDGSPDGTGQIADQLAAADRQVHVVHRQVKQGLGAAYVEAFGVALAMGYDVIGEMDADGSHQPEQLERLMDAIHRGADLAMGSRWIDGGSVVNWPLSRRLISKLGNRYARLLLGIRLGDATGGYRLFRRSTLELIDFRSVESVGYCFQIDLAWRTLNAGLSVTEVPIEFLERARGQSKMTFSVAFESLRRVTVWGIRARLQPDRGAQSHVSV